MVVCSKAAQGTCCTEDRTKKPAWKYSPTNVFVGSSCADARAAFCRSRGTLGSKFCPGISTRPAANRVIPLRSRFSGNNFEGRSINTPVNRITQFGPLQPVDDNVDTPSTPSAPTAPKATGINGFLQDPFGTLCPFFKWVPVGNDCNVQTLVGLTIVIVGGALLGKVIK